MDPRIIKEMMQLSFLRNLALPPSRTSSASTEDSTEPFSALLEKLVAQTGMKEDEVGSKSDLPLSRLPFSPRSNSLVEPSEYDELIARAGEQYGVETGLIKAVIRTESSFNPQAVSKSGAKGLMQLMDPTGRSLGVRDPFDPEQNIVGGTRFLAYLLEKYNRNEAVALAAYNAGPGRIDRLGITTDEELWRNYDRLPEETQSYVTKVQGTRAFE